MRVPLRLAAVVTALVLLAAGCWTEEPPVYGSDLAVLAQNAEGYRQARPGTVLNFPGDHGPHPGFRIEWWYLTANLDDATGKQYGAQWTLFRLATRPPESFEPENPWQSDQMFMAHVGITTPGDHVSFQRYSRGGDHGGILRAGVKAHPFSAWLDDWTLQSTGPGWSPLEVKAQQGDYALYLQLESSAPIILQGDGGFSQKHPNGGGSYYYSQPFLKAKGNLIVDGQKIPVSGEAWLDREWSSQFLQDKQVGWDWFSLHLDSGEKLMLFQLRQQNGGNQDDYFLYGNLIAPDGGSIMLDPDQIQLKVLEQSVIAGRSLPLAWLLVLPQIGRELKITALHPDQWMDVDFPYWEGAVNISGNGPDNSGRGYMELTGYSIIDP
jgi:predicted secreted hydrolase